MKKPSKQNILLLTVRSDTGGGPKHVSEVLSSLKNSSRNQFYVAAPSAGKFAPSLRKWSTAFFQIPFRKFSLITLFEIYLFCRKNHIAVIHSHGFGAGIYSRFLKFFGLKVIHTFHGLHHKEDWKNKLKNRIEKTFTYLSDKLIYVSDSEKKLATKLKISSIKKSVVINNGINFIQLRKNISTSKSMNFEEYGIDSDDIILGTLSRLDSHKGNHHLIRLFSNLPEYYKLFIAGDGPEKRNLKSLIQKLGLEKRVFILGEIPSPYPFLKAIHIYVSASLGEGLPYSVLEAKGANLPLLLSRVPGHLGLIKDESLYDLNNEAEFLEKIKKISLGKDIIDPTWEKLFDLRENQFKLESIYESVY